MAVSPAAIARRTITSARRAAVAAAALGASAQAAAAAKPEPWQLGLPEPVTPLAEQMQVFHDYWLMPIITVITLFVLGLILVTCWRFRESRNPTPSKRTHNSLLEVLWTGIPVVILVVIAFPSLQLLYDTDRVENSEMTVKIVGHQWYWEYQYLDHNFGFDAFIEARTKDEAEEMGVERLMTTDNLVVFPSDTKIRLQMTSGDVIHNWSLSDFGVRMDAVPGRLNEAWTKIRRGEEGMYYGFCSELCGTDHAFMPIAVKVVTPEKFEQWVAEAQEKYAALDDSGEAGGTARTETAAGGAAGGAADRDTTGGAVRLAAGSTR